MDEREETLELGSVDEYRDYVKQQTHSISRELTKVLFGDLDVVVRPALPDVDFGQLAMMMNVALRSAQRALEDKENILEELREQRREVVQQNSKLEAILEATESGILFVDEDHNVAYSNATFSGLLVVDGEALVGKPFDAVIAALQDCGAEADGALEELRCAMDRGERANCVCKITIPQRRTLRIRIHPVRDRSEWIQLGHLLVVQDITVVEDARQAKDELLGNLAHEVRTPLTTIKGFVDLLARGRLGPIAPNQREVLESVAKNVSRLSDLVTNMLDADRLRAGAVERTPTELGPVVRRVVDFEQHRTGARNVEVKVRVEAEPVVSCDSAALEQIVRNLVSNAIKYTVEGEVVVAVRVLGTDALLEVRDTGVGIPPADLERIFDRFHRVDDAHVHSVGGTGVGLSIVRSFVEACGGTVAVESEPGSGSTFRVRLPMPGTCELSRAE